MHHEASSPFLLSSLSVIYDGDKQARGFTRATHYYYHHLHENEFLHLLASSVHKRSLPKCYDDVNLNVLGVHLSLSLSLSCSSHQRFSGYTHPHTHVHTYIQRIIARERLYLPTVVIPFICGVRNPFLSSFRCPREKVFVCPLTSPKRICRTTRARVDTQRRDLPLLHSEALVFFSFLLSV